MVANFECGAAEQELAGVGEAGRFVDLLGGIADGVEQIVAGKFALFVAIARP